MAAAMTFMADKMRSSSVLAAHSSPSIQFFVILIAIIRMLIIMGKLSMAITMLPLFVLEAMADRIESDAEKPNEASSSVRKRSGEF